MIMHLIYKNICFFLKITKKSKTHFNYSGINPTIALNYVLFKTGDDFEKILEKTFKKKAKINFKRKKKIKKGKRQKKQNKQHFLIKILMFIGFFKVFKKKILRYKSQDL